MHACVKGIGGKARAVASAVERMPYMSASCPVCFLPPVPLQLWAVDLDDSQNTVLKLMRNAITVSCCWLQWLVPQLSGAAISGNSPAPAFVPFFASNRMLLTSLQASPTPSPGPSGSPPSPTQSPPAVLSSPPPPRVVPSPPPPSPSVPPLPPGACTSGDAVCFCKGRTGYIADVAAGCKVQWVVAQRPGGKLNCGGASCREVVPRHAQEGQRLGMVSTTMHARSAGDMQTVCKCD